MSFTIALDLVVIAFLVVTIAFALRLNKKLIMVYQSREELQAFLAQFTTSMEKADHSIKDLKGMGESVFKTAQEQMVLAQTLKEDLGFLNERGEELAERLDVGIREARTVQKDLLDLEGSRSRGPAGASAYEDHHEEPALMRHLQNVR